MRSTTDVEGIDELLDALHGTRGGNNLAALDLLALQAAEEGTHVVTSFALMSVQYSYKQESNSCILDPIPCGTFLWGQ